jgi:hypothetical protein
MTPINWEKLRVSKARRTKRLFYCKFCELVLSCCAFALNQGFTVNAHTDLPRAPFQPAAKKLNVIPQWPLLRKSSN